MITLIIQIVIMVLLTWTIIARMEGRDSAADELIAQRDELAQEVDRLREQHTASAYSDLLGAPVIVNVRDGTVVRGVLDRVYRDALVIAHPSLISASAAGATSLGGELVLRLEDVPSLQLTEPAEPGDGGSS